MREEVRAACGYVPSFHAVGRVALPGPRAHDSSRARDWAAPNRLLLFPSPLFLVLAPPRSLP